MAAFSEMILLMCCSRIWGLVTCGLAADIPGPRTSTLSRGGANLRPAKVSSSLRPGLEPYTVLGMFTSPLQPVTMGGVTGATTAAEHEEALIRVLQTGDVASLGRAASPLVISLESLADDTAESLEATAESLT